MEETDVLIVGARCAGCATAIALARLGRRALAIDSAAFPSDTLSTHLLFTGGVAEVARLGALERVHALDPPRHTEAALWGAETLVQGRYSAIGGVAHGLCVRRPGFDHALVETAREAGAEVRERTRLRELVWESGRAVGARVGDGHEIRAKLVVGADGRRSTVGRLVQAREHHRFDNHRLMAFAYYRDPRADERHVAIQWRVGRELGTVFPCDGGLSLVLLMSPVERGGEYRGDPIATFERTVAAIEPMARRLDGCERASKVRVSTAHPSYFRHSSGPGWALAGDAGHFKDPVIAQGIRDALRFGRLLGEAAAPALDDRAALDRALLAWEHERDRQCLPAYQWGNALGLADDVSPLEAAGYRWLAARPGGATEALDVFARVREPQRVFTPLRALRWALDAARGPRVVPGSVGRTLARDLRREAARQAERLAFARRRSVDLGGSRSCRE